MPKDLEGKEMKGPPGLRGAKAAQAMRVKTIDEPEIDIGYQPLKEVKLDLSDNADRRFTDEENYRAYKLFSIIDTSSSGSVTLRELKRSLMGDTFRTFEKRFDHPDTGIVFGLDEDECVVVKDIEKGSPAAMDPYMATGLQVWSINGSKIPPHNKTSLDMAYECLISLYDEPVTFAFVEPILIITKFSNRLDIEFDNEMLYEVELPVGAVNNLQILESKIKLAMRHCDPFLHQIHMSFDGKRRQAYFHSHHDQFRLLFFSGPNRSRSCKFALGFANEDTEFGFKHRGQPMVYDLELGVKYDEAELVFTELFEKFDEDKSGEFEYEEFRDFYIRFLDNEESIQLLRDYAQYKFRDLEKEAYYFEQLEIARKKKERRAALKEREGDRRKEQVRVYKSKSDFDAFGIRRRVYGNRRIDNLKMHRYKRKKGRVAMGKFNKEVKELGDAGEGEGKEDGSQVSLITKDSVKKGLGPLTPAMRFAKRAEIKAMKKDQELARRLKLNSIYNSSEALVRKARRDAFRSTENKSNVHMIEVLLAMKRAARSAIRMGDTGVAGITQLNVSMSHVLATPALILKAGLFTENIDAGDVELKDMSPKELHPATFRYFLIRLPKATNAEFNSTLTHPAFFTSDYEREPSRHSSHGMTVCKYMEDMLIPGQEYREKNGIDARWTHTPPWDTKQEPQYVKFEKPPKPLKSDRLVARCTLLNLTVVELPAMSMLVANSPFVTVICGNVDYEAEAREAARHRFKMKKSAMPEFIQSTESVAFAGQKAQWEDLDWVFRVRANDTLDFKVYTGSARKNVFIGEASLSAVSLIDTPIDKTMHMNLLLTIHKDGEPMGQLNARFKMEVGTEFDWFRNAYQLEQDRIKKEKKFKKFLATRSNAPKTLLPFPLNFVIDEITVMDLVPVHLLTKNSPYVEIEYGDDHMCITEVQSGAGATCHWRDLRFKLRLSHERNNLIFRVLSDETLIGRWAISGEEVNNLPRSKTGELELLGTLITPPPAAPNQTGRIVAKVALNMDSAMIMGPKDSRYLKDIPDGWGNGKDQQPDMSVVTYTSTYTPAPPRGILPLRCQIKYVALTGMPAMHGITGEKNSPRVILRCGRWSKTTVERPHVGENAEWEDLEGEIDGRGDGEFTFPVTDRFNLMIVVMSGNVLVGEYAMTARDLAERPRNTSNVAEIIEDLSDGIELNGKIKLLIYFDHEGDNGFVKAMIDEGIRVEIEQREREAAARGGGGDVITGYGNDIAIPDDVRADGYHFTEVKPFAYDFLPHTNFASQPTEAPFRITINSITAVDLRSVHTLKRNSPSLNAVCGQWGATSDSKKGAGKSATWVGLGWATFVYARNNLRIAVWSDGVLIGAAVITPTRLAACPLDRTGARDILSPLADEGDTSNTGQLKVNFRLESIFDEPEQDPHRYQPLPINLSPPILVTIYTLAVMDLREVHMFGKNRPFVKASCGNHFSVTDSVSEREDGRAGKWENVLWTIYMGEDHTLKLSVHSDSIVIGYVLIKARELCSLPIDTYGLTPYEADLRAGEQRAGQVVGKIRLVCRLEAHFEEDDVSEPDEDAEEKEVRLSEVIRKRPGNEEEDEVIPIPKITFTHILGIVVKDLRSMHTFSSNSPQVILQSGDFVTSTSVQKLKGRNASWLDLHWNLWLTQSSTLKFMVNSGSVDIGVIDLSIQDLYCSVPDDLGRHLLTRNILFEGEKRGTFKVQLTLTDSSLPHLMPVPGLGDGPAERLLFQKGLTPAQKSMRVTDSSEVKDDLDFQRFDHLADTGTHDGLKELVCPVLVVVKKIRVVDLAPIHGSSVIKNSPYVSLTCSGFTRETDAKHRAGQDAMWEGDELDWKFVIPDPQSIIQCTVMSGWSRAGTLSLAVKDVLKMPRDRDGGLILQGNMIRNYRKEALFEEYTVSKGKVQIHVTLAPYVTKEEQQLLDEQVADKIFEESQVPRVLVYVEVVQVAVADLVQVYGLFKNSPAVYFTMGKWTATTGSAYDAGAKAIWQTAWKNVPIRDKADLVAEVMSGNESLGRMTMSVLDIIKMVPVEKRDKESGDVLMEIYGQVLDGEFGKGKVGLVIRVPNEQVDRVIELQMLLKGGAGPGTKTWRDATSATVVTNNSGTTASGRLTYIKDPKHVPQAATGQKKYAYDAGPLLAGGDLELDDGSTIASGDVGGIPVVDGSLLGMESTVSNLTGSRLGDFGTIDNSAPPTANPSVVLDLDLESQQTAATSKSGFAISPAKGVNDVSMASHGGSVEEKEREAEKEEGGDLVYRSAMRKAHSGTKLADDILDRGLDRDSVSGSLQEEEEDEEEDVFRINGSIQSISDRKSQLSVTTPTPVATRVQVDSIECMNLKHAHTFRKNNPVVVVECGDFKNQSRKIIKGGQRCTFDKLGWVFVMRRMTFFRLTVYSDTTIIGSVAISTREILGIPKKGEDTIFRRNIEYESEITGKIRIVCNVDGRFAVGQDRTISQTAIQERKPVEHESRKRLDELPIVAHQDSVRKRALPVPELPMTVRITRINVIDIIPLHAMAPNSPFVQISMGHFKKRTSRAFAAGSSADWNELGWIFDIVDPSATITISVVSGSVKAGSLVLTVSELLGIPRTKQGYTEVSGTVWTDDKLIAGQICVSLLLTPFVSDEAKEKLRKKAEYLIRTEGQTPRLLTTLDIDVVNIVDLTQIYKELHLYASCNKWRGMRITESTKNRKGNIVWGELKQHGWQTINLYERSNLVLEVEGGGNLVGTAVIEPEVVMATPVDEEGHVLIFCDLMDGEVSVGKVSIGGTVEHKLATKHARVREDGKDIEVHSLAITASKSMKSKKSSKGGREGSSVVTSNTSLAQDSVAASLAASQVLIGPVIKEPRWSELCRVSLLSVDECRSVHTIAKNSPAVRLTCGDWTSESRPMVAAGIAATWRDLPWGCFRMKKKGEYSKLKIEVFSRSGGDKAEEYVIGHAELPCELPLEASRDDQNRATFEVKLMHKKKFAGKVIFEFSFLDNTVEKEESEAERGLVPGAKWNLNKTVGTYESTGSHLPHEDEVKDFSALLDPTFVGSSEESSGLLLPGARRNDLKLKLPSSPEGSMSHLTADEEKMLSNRSFAGGFSIATNETNNTPAAGGGDLVPLRPKTSRSLADSASDDQTGRTSRPPLSDRSWLTNQTPLSTERTFDSYTDESGSTVVLRSDGELTPSSGYYSSASSSQRSMDSSRVKPSEFASSRGSSASSTERSGYSDESYTGRSSTGRSGDSYSSRSGYSSYDSDTGRSDWSNSSYTNTGRSSTARTDPLTSGRTDRTETTIEEEGTEVDGSGSEGGDVSEEMKLELHADALQMNASAEAIASKLSKAGIKGPHKLNRSVKKITFDIAPLSWCNPSSTASQATRAFAIELTRGCLARGVANMVMEETNSFETLPFKSPLACFEPRQYDLADMPSYEDIVRDVAIVSTKAAVAKGGSLAMAQALGSEDDATRGSSSMATDDDDDDVDDLPEYKGRVMGDQMGRRRGVVLTDGLGGPNDAAKAQEPEIEEEKEIDYNDRVFGKVRGLYTVPILRGRFEILDILGFDVSFLDKRCVPTRPYLTASKPYGDWAAECAPLWIGNRGLDPKDMHLTYRDLSGQWGWPKVNLRLGQSVVFDFHDGGSGLIFCKLRLRYEMLEACTVDENEIVSCYCEAEIANEYGGGITAGVVRATVDLSVNYWERPKKDADYWLKHTVHHWNTFPLIPVSQGKVKQKHRYVAGEYDKQRIIHPAFYGFRIRWHADDLDESKFKNPIFLGYSLAKKPPTKRMEMEARKLEAMRSSTNPFHYDVMAASLGKCPVCGDGQPGCPRCFMMPSAPNGDIFGPDDFAFDPIKEQALKAAEEARVREREMHKVNKLKNQMRLRASGKVTEDDLEAGKVDSDEETDSKVARDKQAAEDETNKKVSIHTKLTTFRSVELYRTVVQEYITVFVKVLPGAYIRKIQVVPDDIVFNLWNRFCSHSDLGLSDSKMMLLPTSKGIFEMCNDIDVEDEFTRADNRGREKLSRYGFKGRKNMLCCLFCPRYLPEYTNKLLTAFFKRNSGYKVHNVPTHTHVDDVLPKDVPNDPIQIQLVKICANLYNLQQIDYKNQYKELGELFRVNNAAAINEKIQKLKEERARALEEKARERRMESQLKGLEGEERERKRHQLLELEKHRKGNASALAEEENMSKRERDTAQKEKRARFLAKQDGAKTAAEKKAEEEEASRELKKRKEELAKLQAKIDEAQSSDDDTTRPTTRGTEAGAGEEDQSYTYDEYSDEEDYYDSDDDSYDSDEDYGSEDEREGDEEVTTSTPRAQDVEELMEGETEGSTEEAAAEAKSGVELDEAGQGGPTGDEERKDSSTNPDSREDSRGSERSRSRGSSRGSWRSAASSSSYDSDESDATETYSISTGTYTSRTGWSQADDWTPPPTWRSDDSRSGSGAGSRSESQGGNGEATSISEDGGGEEDAEENSKENRSKKSTDSREGKDGGSEASRASHGAMSGQIGGEEGEEQEGQEEAGNEERVDTEGDPSLSRRSSAYSSTTLSTESSATSVALSSDEIYDRIAYSRPSTGSSMYSSSSYTDSYYYGETPRTGRSDYSHHSDATSRSRGSRFSFGTPRSGGDFDDDDEDFERQYRRKYSYGTDVTGTSRRTFYSDYDESRASTGRTDASSGMSSGSSTNRPRLLRATPLPSETSDGSYTSRSGTSMTDFTRTSDSRPSTGETLDSEAYSTGTGTDYTPRGDSHGTSDGSYTARTGYSSYTETSYTGTTYSSRSGTSRSTATATPSASATSRSRTNPSLPMSHASDDYTESYAGSVASSEEEAGKERTTEENIRMAQLRAAGGGYGKGSKRPDHRKMAQRDKRHMRNNGAVSGLSLSARMTSSVAAASEELIMQGYEKDKRAARGLPPVEHEKDFKYTRLAPTDGELNEMHLGVPGEAVAMRLGEKMGRKDAMVDGVPDTFLSTEPSPMYFEMKQKEEEMAKVMAMSNPSSRGGSRPGTKGKKRPGSKGKKA